MADINNKAQFLEERIKIWDELKASQPVIEEKPIKVTLPDGAQVDAVAGKTTPYDVALGISKGLAQHVITAKVNGVMYDLMRPLESDCSLQLFKFDSPEGKKVFWHSSAHVLGQALEKQYGAILANGPPLKEGGFYYDFFYEEVKEGDKKEAGKFSEKEYQSVNSLVSKIAAEKQPFERLVLSKEQALQLFKYNKYKIEFITEKVPEGGITTVYRCGTLIDLCKGPHVPHTGKVSAFSVWKNSSAYFKGDSEKDSLQRVYGISFPDNKQMKEWKEIQEKLQEQDHRRQGLKQELFFFDPLSPGCPFLLPRGARIYHKLIDFMRSQYRKRGFQEVSSPNMFNTELWKTSGHYEHYKENMFLLNVEKLEFALKPMNCPGHCLMFSHRTRSHKELPIRFADFGVLHRNELAGALTGLTRVRRFCQDDAHIFCRLDQIAQEIKGALEFLRDTYSIFNFKFEVELSTRPEKKFMGEIEVWNKAEEALSQQLDEFCGKGNWALNPGDGAFYGPKIDIKVFDVYKRQHQCATIQLDFQLPKRFHLSYMGEDGTNQEPVIIHRAVLGSLERFFAILIEQTAGKWPFWLSPRPIIIVPVAPKFNEYGNKVLQQLFNAGFDPEIDESGHKFEKKIRDAQVTGYNFILVVGAEEQAAGTVNVRTQDNVVHGTKQVEALIEEFKDLVSKYQ